MTADKKVRIAAIAVTCLVTLAYIGNFVHTARISAEKPKQASQQTAEVADVTATFKPSPLRALEIERLVNIERQKVGLPPFSHSDELTISACAKLDDMVAKDYWSHYDPSGQGPWHFILDAGYSYSVAHENLAIDQTSEAMVVSDWMNSPAHRANIVDESSVDQGICSKSVYVQKHYATLTVQHSAVR